MNHPLVAVTPDEAKALALGWIEMASAVVLGVIAALSLVLPRIAALKTQVQTLFKLHGQNTDAITTLALHTPVPTPAADALAQNTEATKENTAAVEAAKLTGPSL